MSEFLDVKEIFDTIYILDITPSLLAVAEKRFKKLGFTNVQLICADAASFRLGQHAKHDSTAHTHADLITMSHSLSLILDFYPTIDMCETVLSPYGLFGIVDFYVANEDGVSSRNYTAGFQNRHIYATKRIFWNAWFDLDHIKVDSSRRDYVEFRFGNICNINTWNYHYRFVPYYVWLGCKKQPASKSSEQNMKALEQAFPSARKTANQNEGTLDWSSIATQNRKLNLPLPSYAYQIHPWRLPYQDQSSTHHSDNPNTVSVPSPTEWTSAHARLSHHDLRVNSTVLTFNASPSTILAYALSHPSQLTVINPSIPQNHILELTLAALHTLSPSDTTTLFSTLSTSVFCSILIDALSPHLSGRALSWWLHRAGRLDKTHKTPLAT